MLRLMEAYGTLHSKAEMGFELEISWLVLPAAVLPQYLFSSSFGLERFPTRPVGHYNSQKSRPAQLVGKMFGTCSPRGTPGDSRWGTTELDYFLSQRSMPNASSSARLCF